jgi:tetratricopeptide (TPR) repeat protein
MELIDSGERKIMKIKYIFLLGAAMLLAGVLTAQDLPSAGTTTTLPTAAPTMLKQGPMSSDEVLTELKNKTSADELIKDIKERGVDFELDADTEKKFHKAKATEAVIDAIKDASPKKRAEAAKAAAIASGATILSKDERADLQAIETEVDPDKTIALAEECVKKHSNTELQSYAYVFEAYAYEKKDDAEKTLEYAEKSLALKKDNLLALLALSHVIPQPRYINHHQADEDKELARAMSVSQDAEQAIGQLKKLADETDADFANRKAGYMCDLYGDRGMVHLDLAQLGLLSLDTDELKKSVEEYNKAVACTPPVPTDYFRLGDAYRMLGMTDEAIGAYSKASQLGQGVLKQYADQQVAALKASKAASKP